MTNLSTFLPIFFSTLVLCIAVLIAWYIFTHPRVLLPPASPIVDEEKAPEAVQVDEVPPEPPAPEADDVVADHPEIPPEPEPPRAPTPPQIEEEEGEPEAGVDEGGGDIIEIVEETPVAPAAPV